MIAPTKTTLAVGSLVLAFSASVGLGQGRPAAPGATPPRGAAASSALPTSVTSSPGRGEPSGSLNSAGLNSGSVNSAGLIRIGQAKLICLHKIQVAAQSDGLVEKLLADEGQLVSKGDSLLKIDSRVAAAELEVARKELEAAVKQAAQTAEVEYAQKASAVADEEYKNEKALFDKGSSTFSQTRRKLLEAERSRLGHDVAQVKHETEGLAADVARAKLRASQVRLNMFDVLAPYDGVIVERLRDEGEWIRAGEPVLRLVHMNEMKVEGQVEVGGFSLVDLQNAPMKVIVQVNPQQNYEIPTQVEFVSPEILSNRVRVSAKIDNQRIGDTWLLRDGMNATLEIQLPTTP